MNHRISTYGLACVLSRWATAVAVLLISPIGAQAAAKWTEIVVAEGAYEQMDDRFQRVGATDDVNVVVLHSPGMGGPLRSYQVMKDTVAGHTPGICCPGVTTGVAGCCALKEIPLTDIGITNAGMIDLPMIEKFWKYAQTKFPADHYILNFRGMPGMGASRIYESGMNVANVAAAVGRFGAAMGGRKVDIVAMTFCLAGSTDWSYAFAKVADFYVAPANWTNSPVAARWRVNRWAEELIKKPTMSPREVATMIVDVFAEVGGNECAAGCTNLDIGEPWTAGVSDLSQGKAYALATRDFVCSYLEKFDRTRDKPILDTAKLKTVPYGATDRPDINVEHFDMKHFAINLKNAVTDANIQDKLTKMIAAQEKYTFKHVLEPTGFSSFGGNSFGLSGYFNTFNGAVYSTPEKIGPWMIDSLWKLFIAKVENVSVVTTVTSLVVDGPALEVVVGGTLDLTARGVNTSFPSGMCPAANVTWTVDNTTVGSLSATNTNPVQLTGLVAGQVTVTAIVGGKMGTVTITVTGGGTTATGGTLAEGGATATGGSSAMGGTKSGGAIATGGTSSSGGTGAMGGAKTGGHSATGGTKTGGTATSGGTKSGGSTSTSGSSPANGGSVSTGVSSRTGGSASTSGQKVAGPTSSGCGCRIGGHGRDTILGLPLLGLGIGLAALRRRKGRRG